MGNKNKNIIKKRVNEVTVEVNDNGFTNRISCFDLEESHDVPPDISRIAKISLPIIETLGISNPYVSMCPLPNIYGYSYVKEIHRELDSSVLIVDLDKAEEIMKYMGQDNEFLVGIIAHELRHIWQGENDLKLYKSGMACLGPVDSDTCPAEIDADAFAIYWLSKVYGREIEECSEYVYQCEAMSQFKWLRAREVAAYKIMEGFRN